MTKRIIVSFALILMFALNFNVLDAGGLPSVRTMAETVSKPLVEEHGLCILNFPDFAGYAFSAWAMGLQTGLPITEENLSVINNKLLDDGKLSLMEVWESIDFGIPKNAILEDDFSWTQVVEKAQNRMINLIEYYVKKANGEEADAILLHAYTTILIYTLITPAWLNYMLAFSGNRSKAMYLSVLLAERMINPSKYLQFAQKTIADLNKDIREAIEQGKRLPKSEMTFKELFSALIAGNWNALAFLYELLGPKEEKMYLERGALALAIIGSNLGYSPQSLDEVSLSDARNFLASVAEGMPPGFTPPFKEMFETLER